MLMKSYSMLQTSSFTEKQFSDYSRFKHGSKTVARIFGKTLAQKIGQDLFKEQNKSFIIYPAPFNNIPTASSALRDYLLSFLSFEILKSNSKIKQGKVHRLYSYDNDYGRMSKEDRQKAISSDIFSIDKSFILPTDTLVFIDDIKITGSHEERIKELLARENITNEVIFIYLYEYTGDDPVTEDLLNHFCVKNLKDINDIIRNDKFVFNTRVIKFILKADIEEFVSFITYQSDIFQETLYHYSILNEYYNNEKYSVNFSILHSIVTKNNYL